MQTRPLAFALLLSLAPAATLPARIAFAQSADDATTKMARQRFQEGVNFYDKGQFEMARAAFLQAYALRKHPVVLLNLAQSCLKTGHALEAARYFQQFLKESSSATDAQRADASKGLGEARMKLGRIDVVGATVGADVFVDDERIGMAPLDHSVDVEAGSHLVRSQGRGGEQSIPVTAVVGQGVTARFSASAPAPAAAPPPPAPAETPAEPAPAPPPEAAAAPPPPAQPPEEEARNNESAAHSSGSTSHHWGWVAATGAVTVVGFTTALIMGFEKSSAQNSANTVAQAIEANGGGQGTCYVGPNSPTPKFATACNDLNTDDNNVNADATVANVGIAVGIAGGVGFIISTIVAATSYSHTSEKAPPSPTAAIPVTVVPVVHKGFEGLSVVGSF
jgi:hypothetical protein